MRKELIYPHVCENCGMEYTNETLEPMVEGYGGGLSSGRLTPGDIVPSGECRECGALCYLKLDPTPAQTLLQAARDIIENNVPIPDKSSDYVVRSYIAALRVAVREVENA